MKLRAAVPLTVFSVAFLGSIACGAKTPTEPTPPAPVFEHKTETFAGSVATGGSKAFPFTVVNPGTIQVGITALAPTSTLVMGLSLGYWEAATLTCVEQQTTELATINVFFAATPSSPGEYCVGIFDTGNVTVASDFTLSVTHY